MRPKLVKLGQKLTDGHSAARFREDGQVNILHLRLQLRHCRLHLLQMSYFRVECLLNLVERFSHRWIMEQRYFGFVTLTQGRRIIAVAGFDREQADVALSILSLPEASRREHGVKLYRLIQNGVNPEDRIQCTPRTQTGLVTAPSTGLGVRAAKLVALACMMGKDAGVEAMKRSLERISAGLVEHGTIQQPFLLAEGFKPKPTPT